MQLCEIAEDTDVDAQVFEDTLAGIEAELEVKADAYAVILTNLDNDVEKIDKEIERLTKMKKTLKSRSDFLKRNLTNTMLLMDKKKFKTDIHSYSISKNAPSLNILDEALMKRRFRRNIWSLRSRSWIEKLCCQMSKRIRKSSMVLLKRSRQKV